MDVRCERCKTEYELDDARVTEAGVPVKCATCGYVFRVKKKALVVTVPMRPGEPMDGAAPLTPAGSHVDKGREWRIRYAQGNVMTLRELTTLQRWIVERKVSRADEISLTGENWKKLGDIPELLPFFEVVDEAQRAHAMLQAQTEANANAPLPLSLSPPRVAAVMPEPPVPSPAPAPVMTPPPAPMAREPVTQIPVPPAPAPWSQLPETTVLEDLPPQPRSNSADKWRAIGAPPEAPRPPTPGPSRAVRTAARRSPSETELPIADFKGNRRRGGWVVALVVVVLAGLGAYYFWIQASAPALPAQRTEVKAASPASSDTHEPSGEVTPSPNPPPPASPVTPSIPLDASVVEAMEPKPLGEEPPVALDAGSPGASAPAPVDAGMAAKKEVVRDFDFYIAQGDRLRERDKPEAAMNAYGKAAALSPNRAEAQAGRGLALLDLGRKPQAESSFQQALKLNPRYSVALMGLAETYRAMGKKDDAIRFYEKYLDVAPSGTEAAAARTAVQKLQE